MNLTVTCGATMLDETLNADERDGIDKLEKSVDYDHHSTQALKLLEPKLFFWTKSGNLVEEHDFFM